MTIHCHLPKGSQTQWKTIQPTKRCWVFSRMSDKTCKKNRQGKSQWNKMRNRNTNGNWGIKGFVCIEQTRQQKRYMSRRLIKWTLISMKGCITTVNDSKATVQCAWLLLFMQIVLFDSSDCLKLAENFFLSFFKPNAPKGYPFHTRCYKMPNLHLLNIINRRFNRCVVSPRM